MNPHGPVDRIWQPIQQRGGERPLSLSKPFMWPKKMSFDSSIILLYSANRPYRTTENSIRGLVITIIDSLSALAPPRDQDLRPPCKKLPQKNNLWGSFYRAGRTPSRGEQLGDWWQLRRDGRLGRFRRGGCGGGELLRLLLPGLQSLGLYVWSTPFFHAARNLRIQHAVCPLDRRFFKPLPGAFPPSAFAEI